MFIDCHVSKKTYWVGRKSKISANIKKIKAYSSIQVAASKTCNQKVSYKVSQQKSHASHQQDDKLYYIHYIFKYGVLAKNPSFLTKLLGGLSLPKHQTVRPPFAESHQPSLQTSLLGGPTSSTPTSTSPADAPWVAPHAVHWRAEYLNHDDEWPKRLAETEADVGLSDGAWKMGSQDGRKLT